MNRQAEQGIVRTSPLKLGRADTQAPDPTGTGGDDRGLRAADRWIPGDVPRTTVRGGMPGGRGIAGDGSAGFPRKEVVQCRPTDVSEGCACNTRLDGAAMCSPGKKFRGPRPQRSGAVVFGGGPAVESEAAGKEKPAALGAAGAG